MNKETIENLKQKTHALIDEYTALLTEVDDLMAQAVSVRAQEINNRQFERELIEKEKKLYIEMASIKSEREFITKTQAELMEQKLKLENDIQHVKDIEEASKEFESLKSDHIAQEKSIQDKMRQLQIEQERLSRDKANQLEYLNEKQRQIDEKESMVNRAASIDAERKRLLDVREARIQMREKQLSIDQQE